MKWNNVATEIRERTGKYTSFSDLVKFTSREADKAVDPISSLQAVRGTHEKPMNVTIKKRIAGTYTIVTGTQSKEEQDKSLKPETSNTHTTHNCHSFIAKTPSYRREFVKGKGLCFGCLNNSYMPKGCPYRSNCKICNGRHPTCLHGAFAALNCTEFSKSHETKGPRAKKPAALYRDISQNWKPRRPFLKLCYIEPWENQESLSPQ